MNSFKTRGAADSREGIPFGSRSSSSETTRPTAEDLFFHFSMAMRSFQPLTFRRAEAWSGPTPDLPYERILRLDGTHPFVCVVRTQDRLESALSDPAAPTLRTFDRLVMGLGKGLARQVLSTLSIEEVSFFLRRSTPRFWPAREPEALCRVWVGATPLEIRFWMI